MNKTIPEYERSYIHGRSVQTICQNMEDRISIGKNEQDYTRNMKDRISMGEAYNNARIWKIRISIGKMNKDYTRI